MTVLEEACLLSCERWVDSFPLDVPEHQFSKKHQKAMQSLLNSSSASELKLKFSKHTFKILLIAAVLLALTITAIAVPLYKEYSVKKFSNHSDYEVLDSGRSYEVESLVLNYVPQGFVLTEEYIEYVRYENKDRHFAVEKISLNGSISFNTENYPSEEIMINGIKGVYFRADEEESGIIFNNGKYIFSVGGNISKEELVQIAQSVA